MIMLEKIFILIILLIIAVIIMFFMRGKASQKGQASGVIDGKLTKCSPKPNGVCSEFPDDQAHYVEPINVSHANMGQHFHKVSKAIIANGGEIISQTEDYLAATFTSNVFRFVDDVEARLDKDAKLIHLRSASRQGYSDLGVNAKRIAAIKKSYSE
jgi:uncharacterized protein (DUF1499 family)